jgi:hypothetical protein
VQGLPYLYLYHGHEQVLLMGKCLVLYVTEKVLLRKINPYSEGYIMYFGVSLVKHIVFRNTRNSIGA